MKRCASLIVLLTLLTGCSNEETLAIAASTGKFTPTMLHNARVGMHVAEAMQKATSAEDQAAIMAKYYCELAYESRRDAWLGMGMTGMGLPAGEHAGYMRADPAARAQYWQGVSRRLGCAF